MHRKRCQAESRRTGISRHCITIDRMRSPLALTAMAVAALAGALMASAGGPALARPPAPPAPDLATWLYGAHRWPGASVLAELGRLPADARRLYLSVEDGTRLLLDEPDEARRLGVLLDAAHARLGLAVDAMLLQDPAWASDPEGAIRRAARVLAFHAARRAAGRQGFTGLHFDVEPHTEEAWRCADARARRETVLGLQRVFAGVARLARDAAGPGLRLSAALPWWLGPLSAEVREAAPAAWLAGLDEVVLMVYGDPGGPLVGESPAAVLRRVDDARLWAELPPGRGLRIGLATHEYRDAAALQVALREVAAALAQRPGFRGLAVFAHGRPFDAPLVTSLEGRVLDPQGRPVAGARVRAADQETRSNRCGLFLLRRLPAPAADVAIDADGFTPARVSAPGLTPGRHRELAPVVLRRAP